MNVQRLSFGTKHHFFGYYGINPWDRTSRYHLALETDFHTHRPLPEDVASVGLVDRDTHQFTPYAKTSAFNLQQGSMMHWIGNITTDESDGVDAEFTFNDWEDGALISRALNPTTGVVRTIQGAIAAVSPTARHAIGLNYERMAHCRPVVGYATNSKSSSIEAQPEADGLYQLNLQDGSTKLVLSIADVIRKSADKRMIGRRTWFNHVLFNTDGTRLLFFCRVRQETGFYTSLWTVNPDGSDLEMQIPFGYRVSHFDWRTPTRILVSSDIVDEMGFVEFTDGARDFTPIGRGVLPNDGHASFSPDRQWLLCDTYPRGPERLAQLLVYNIDENRKIVLGEFHHEEQFTGDIRCDLHPRWALDGKTVTFDSVHEGDRQIYLVDLSLSWK
ncbi:hypothetical protein J5I95_12065 [Candidatus Poribacteria bacterium]|nr:hypothetical protein [Candidatus Poribacteria bacterium]